MSQQVIYVDGLGFVPIQEGQTPQQAIAVAQASASEKRQDALAISGGLRQQVGFQMPQGAGGEGFEQAMQEIIAAFPQVASFIAQLFPQARAFGMAAGAGIPAAARTVTNLAEGKPLSEGVMSEALLGSALHVPTSLGKAATKWGTDITRHNLAKSPRIGDLAEQHGKDFVENELPAMALARRAAPTRRGVTRATDRAVEMTGEAQDAMKNARTMLDGIPAPSTGEKALRQEAIEQAGKLRSGADKEHALANVLEDLRFGHSMRGSGSSMTSVLPGSGAATTVARAAQLPAAAAQIASPAVAMAKGSPARRMAFARTLHRPGNIVDSDTLGYGISQLLRLLAAAKMEPVPSHERATAGSSGGGLPARAPRRRGQP